MESAANKLFVIKELLQSKIYDSIEKIGAKLPDDLSQKRIFNSLLADNNYPFKSTQTLGGAKFTLLPKHPILGRAWKDPRGLSWNGVVQDEQEGRDREMNWETAKKYCFSLNRDADIKKVEAALEAIESNQELNKLRVQYVYDTTIENRIILLKKYEELRKKPIPGCYLPPVEDLIMLALDFGYQEENSQAIAQFLPLLYDKDLMKWFWSLSVIKGDDDEFNNRFAFNSNFDTLNGFKPTSPRSVLCTCGPEVPAY
jgi:hypothetical protein